MSRRTPTTRDVLLALTTVGYTEDEAAEGVDRIKKRGIGIGHLAAQENMQASIGGAFREAQAKAWDEGLWGGEDYHNGRSQFENGLWDTAPELPPNPYRGEQDDE